MGILGYFFSRTQGKNSPQLPMPNKSNKGTDFITANGNNRQRGVLDSYEEIQQKENEINEKMKYIQSKCDELNQIISKEYEKPEEEWDYGLLNECNKTIDELDKQQSQLWELCRQLANIEKDILNYKGVNMESLDRINKEKDEAMERVIEILDKFFQQTKGEKSEHPQARKRSWQGQPLKHPIEGVPSTKPSQDGSEQVGNVPSPDVGYGYDDDDEEQYYF